MKLDLKTMEEFIRNFKPEEYKYLRYIDSKTKQQAKERLQQMDLPESDVRLTLDDIEDIYQTVKQVYGGQEDEFCRIIRWVTEKFLGNYVNIEGMNQMFRSSYFYFEWMMHLEYNPNKHSYTYYRDHYVHQIKNMYSMFCFLDDLGYEEICYDWYRQADNRVAEFLRNSVRDELDRRSEGQKIKDILKTLNEANKSENLIGPQVEKALYGYIFYASAIIASLLHDIGYPIAYVGRTVKSLGEFLPFSHLFVQEVDTDATIHSVLQDSLLYKVAGQKEIAERVGEKDHGALSAVILLYKYYDNGKIATLSPIKQAAIELAALMIYNHTLKYQNQGEKKSKYYKNIFKESPMSYLFRLCDDLQEWGRVYFEISSRSNFFVCGKCYMPMTRTINREKKNSLQTQTSEKLYSCWCGARQGKNTTNFMYRKMLNIDSGSHIEISREGNNQRIKIVYDKERLLQLAAYSPSFAVVRGKGVWEIKKMLEKQGDFPNTFLDAFVSNNPIWLKVEILLEWVEINIDSFTNYVEEKLKEINNLTNPSGDSKPQINSPKEQINILIGLMETLKEKKSELETYWGKIQRKLWKELEKMDKEWRKEKYPKKQSSFCYMQDKAYFYFYLAFFGKVIQRMRKEVWVSSYKENKQALNQHFFKMKDIICERFNLSDKVEIALTGLVLEQKAREFDEGQFRRIHSSEERELYLSFCQHNDYDIDLVTCYVQEQAYAEIKKDAWNKSAGSDTVSLRYDYYSDYYLYYTIAEMTKNKKS